MPRRATRQQRQQRSAEAEEVESAKPHMQPTKGGRARRAPWPLGSSSGGRRPLCVFRVRNPDLSEAERVQFFSEATEEKNSVCTAPRTRGTTAQPSPGHLRTPTRSQPQQPLPPARDRPDAQRPRSTSSANQPNFFPTQPTRCIWAWPNGHGMPSAGGGRALQAGPTRALAGSGAQLTRTGVQ